MAGFRARRAVIFDLYGTLVDLQLDEESPRFWNALASDPIVSDRFVSGAQLKGVYTRLLREASEHSDEGFLLNAVFSEMLEQLILAPTFLNLSQLAAKFRKYSTTQLSKKYYTDDLLELIKSSGYKLGLVSNTEALLTAYDLQVLGLEERFDAMVLSSSAGVKKPERRIFTIILEKLGLEPQSCVFVGDNLADDILGAVNAGIDAIFLTDSSDNQREYADQVGGKIACAGFKLKDIVAALSELGFVLPHADR